MARVASIRVADLVPLAWGALRRNRLRSVLTIGAIAFGVAVLVYLVALGQGLQELTVGSVLRSSTLLSFTVSSFNKDIKPLDIAAQADIKAIPNAKLVLPRLTVKGMVALGNKRADVTVVGVDPDYFSANDKAKIKVGMPFGEGETNSILVTTQFLKLLGMDSNKTPLVTFDLQVDKIEYGDIPLIKDAAVRGVIEDDIATAVYLPRDYLEGLLGKKKPDYENILVMVSDLNQVEQVSNDVIALGYKVQTVVDTVDSIKRIFSYITWTMVGLGLIAIIVASIGMFNTLTVSLLERTREIGIMKALGVKKGDVRRLFLSEAILIGLFGGVVGIALAVLFEVITNVIFELLAVIASGNSPELFQNPWYLPVSALLFSVCIAILTGIYPSSRAAKLNPIDAIRKET